MAVDVAPLPVSDRPVAPSNREVETGQATAHGAAWTPEVRPVKERVPLGVRLREMAAENNPRKVVEGFSPYPMLAFAVMGLVFGLQSQALVFALPQLREIGVDALVVGLLVGVAQGSWNAVGGAGIGFLADRYQMRTFFLRWGAVLRTVGITAAGFASGTVTFVSAYLVGTIGFYAIQPQQTILADIYPVEKRLRQGFFQAKMSALALVGGPTLAGAITVLVGWQWMVVIFGLLGIPVTAMLWRIKEPRQGAMDAPTDEQLAPQKPVGFGEALSILWSVRTLRFLLLGWPFFQVTFYLVVFGGTYFAYQWQLGPLTRGYVVSAAGAGALLGLIVFAPLYRSFSQFKQGRLLVMASLLLAFEAVCGVGMVLAPNVWFGILFFVLIGLCVTTVQQATSGILLAVLPARVRTFGLELTQFATFFAPMYTLLLGPWLTSQLFSILGINVSQGALVIAVYIPAILIGAFFIARASRMVEPDIRSAIAVAAAEATVSAAKEQGENKLLVVRGLEVFVGGAQILFGINLDIEEGEIVALLGTNGAGKSTLLRAISGVRTATSGGILYDGDDITHTAAHINARNGIVMLPGGHAVFPEMTVAENLRIAGWLNRKDGDDVQARIEDVLTRFPRLRDRIGVRAGSMSGGEQQMLAVSQALLMRPRLLMIDELSLGLAPPVVAQLLDIVREVAAQGTTVILVEQSVNVALEIAERVVFMDHGEVLYDGPADRIHEHREIFHAIFLTGGTNISRAARPRAFEESEEVALRVDNASVSFGGVRALDDVSLDVRAGEIVGMVGPNGSGKTTLFDAISGFVPLESGVITLLDTDISHASPDVRAQIGLGRSFQNVRLFPGLTVRENLAVALDRIGSSRSSFAAALRLPNHTSRERRAQRRIDSLVETLGLQRYAESFIGELSTGTRRIVDFGCILASNPRVLLLDEPSSGLAQAEVEEMGPLVMRISRELGCSVLIIEHDLAMVSAISQRLVVMELGHIVRAGAPAELLGDSYVRALLSGGDSAALHRSGSRRALEPLLAGSSVTAAPDNTPAV